jgi:uncharacterized protein YkwD
MAFLIYKETEKMLKNLKNSIVFILATVAILLIFSISLIAASPASKIEVRGNSVSINTAVKTEAANAPSAVLNEYENAIAALINNHRVENGLNAIAYDGTLTNVAKLRSQDLMDRNYFSHYTPEGTNVFDLFRANGINFKIGGENLGQAMPASIGTPEAFLNAWTNSPSHNANMLRVGYNFIGVGMVDNGDRIVVTTVFTN